MHHQQTHENINNVNVFSLFRFILWSIMKEMLISCELFLDLTYRGCPRSTSYCDLQCKTDEPPKNFKNISHLKGKIGFATFCDTKWRKCWFRVNCFLTLRSGGARGRFRVVIYNTRRMHQQKTLRFTIQNCNGVANCCSRTILFR